MKETNKSNTTKHYSLITLMTVLCTLVSMGLVQLHAEETTTERAPSVYDSYPLYPGSGDISPADYDTRTAGDAYAYDADEDDDEEDDYVPPTYPVYEQEYRSYQDSSPSIDQGISRSSYTGGAYPYYMNQSTTEPDEEPVLD